MSNTPPAPIRVRATIKHGRREAHVEIKAWPTTEQPDLTARMLTAVTDACRHALDQLGR